MSQTVASALGNRIVTFVNTVDSDFDCAICHQVADELVRCSGMCSGVFCSTCMTTHLNNNSVCPICSKFDIKALKDVLTINQILKQDVYCLNKGIDQSDNIDQHTSTDSRKRKAAPDDDKCTWIGKYDQLAAHLKQCDYEIVKCNNNGCEEEIQRRQFESHNKTTCGHRLLQCNHCKITVKANLMSNHITFCPKLIVNCACEFSCAREELQNHWAEECPLVKIQCDIIGCNAWIRRVDMDKHRKGASSEHIQLLSDEVERIEQHNKKLVTLVDKLYTLIIPKPMTVNWNITDISRRMTSSRFEAFCQGNQMLYISANINDNALDLRLYKDNTMSRVKGSLSIGGSSFTVSKAGLPDVKETFPANSVPLWGLGFDQFLPNVQLYIDCNCINVTLHLILSNGEDELTIL